MPEPRNCERCGAPLPADAPEWACPRCLLAAGLEGGSGAGGGGAASAAPSAADIARHFPMFEILETLGQGGMGVVYKAKQRSLDRIVALKVMPPEAAREAGFAERFTREARTLARLQHPNIVGVHDFGSSDGLYYLVMEFVDGANLREAMRDGKLTPRQALAVVPQVCDALQYAHDQGVVHRDVKPENILLDRSGRVRIADFGLAKIVQRTPVDVTITRAGQVMGTLHYMAPEQYREPDSVDHRADIYSLGVVFYEMLTGELPLGSFPPPSQKPGVDARLDGVVLRALERERDRRWQNVSEVKDRVSAISTVAPPEAGATVDPTKRPEAAKAGPAALPPPSAPPPTPAAPAEPPRLSRLAVAGALAVPASMALSAAAWGITGIFTSGGTEDLLCATVGFSLGCAVLVAGMIVSIAAWAQIKHSKGRLTGLPWAVMGTFLAPSFLCCGVPAMMFAMPGVRVQEGPDGRTVRMPFLSVEEKDGRTRVKMPFLDVDTADTPDTGDLDRGDRAERVHRGPPGMTDFQRRMLATDLEVLWTDAVASLGFDPSPDDRERLLPDEERARWRSMTDEQRDALRETRKAGLPFADPRRDLGAQHIDFRLVAIDLAPDGLSARVVRSTGRVTISFPVRKHGDQWRFGLGEFEREDRAPVNGDHDGRLDPGPIPAAGPGSVQVSGGPASLSDEQRQAIMREIDAIGFGPLG
ncbi:MAG TPA: serine/threonine-protein kinase, partial [Planctomycetota bacterium]|nr:serine/threonine-protein kinase [Planctomycetota bacterium]